MSATTAHEQLTGRLNYRGHIARLDVLRGAAVLGVLVCHDYSSSTDWTHWHGVAAAWIAFTMLGHLGVHLFFVLSGFLITGILLEARNKDPRKRARHFYLRRARRILPACIATLAAIWLAHIVDWRFVLASILFVVNFGRILGVQIANYAVVWSLAVEEQFYLLWPWIVWRCSMRNILRAIVACLILSPWIRFALAAAGADTYTKPYTNLDYLMYGALVACMLRTGQIRQGNVRRIMIRLYVGGIAAVALLGALRAAVHAGWVPVIFDAVGRLPFIAIFVALLLSAVLAHQSAAAELGTRRGWFGRMLAFLGYISYGLYLVQTLVIRLYDAHVAGTRLGGFQHSFALLTFRAAVCTLVSILLAWLSRSTLEEWFLRCRPLRSN